MKEEKMAKLLDTERAYDLMTERGIDILVGDGFINFGYIAGYFTHFGLDYPGPLYDGTPLIRFAGIPRDEGISPFLITYPGEEGDMVEQGTWIEDKIYYGPPYNVPGRPSPKLEMDPVRSLAAALRDRGLSEGTIGLDMQSMSVAVMRNMETQLPKAKFVDAHDDFYTLRMIKTPEEIDRLRNAVKGAERGYKAVIESLQEGMNALELAAIVKKGIIDADTDRYIIHVAFGKKGAISYTPNRSNRLKRGDLVAVDIAALYKYYSGDMFRTFSFGKPSDEAVRIHRALDEVNTKVVESIRPGIKASDLFKIGSEAMKERGLFLTLNLVGHSVGLDVHEPPFLVPHDNTVLQPNMVLVLEIGTRNIDVGNFCSEITVLVNDDGCEILNSVPYSLTVVD
jgi:Xaa-Pro aminopeptidase